MENYRDYMLGNVSEKKRQFTILLRSYCEVNYNLKKVPIEDPMRTIYLQDLLIRLFDTIPACIKFHPEITTIWEAEFYSKPNTIAVIRDPSWYAELQKRFISSVFINK